MLLYFDVIWNIDGPNTHYGSSCFRMTFVEQVLWCSGLGCSLGREHFLWKLRLFLLLMLTSLERQQIMDQILVSLPSSWGILMEFLASCFGLASAVVRSKQVVESSLFSPSLSLIHTPSVF